MTVSNRSVPEKMSAGQWRAAKKVSLGEDFVLVKIGNSIEANVKPGEKAVVLMSKAASALKSPGIARQTVFRGAVPNKVYAYSALPTDASKLVRESADGRVQIGRIDADGKFRILRK